MENENPNKYVSLQVETHRLLANAVFKIQALERVNELQSAKLEMFEMVMSALHATPPSRGVSPMGEDIVWQLERHLNKLDKEMEKMPQQEEDKREEYKHRSVDKQSW
jgi:hypothetical protein